MTASHHTDTQAEAALAASTFCDARTMSGCGATCQLVIIAVVQFCAPLPSLSTSPSCFNFIHWNFGCISDGMAVCVNDSPAAVSVTCVVQLQRLPWFSKSACSLQQLLRSHKSSNHVVAAFTGPSRGVRVLRGNTRRTLHGGQKASPGDHERRSGDAMAAAMLGSPHPSP